MSKDFYSSESYREKQSRRTALNWQVGRMDFLKKSIARTCSYHRCLNTFTTTPADPKRYCSSRCAAIENNSGRTQSAVTKSKIRRALAGRIYPERRVPPRFSFCLNPKCGKRFILKFWRPAHNPIKYCSRMCAIKDVGSRPTSPRAARAKAGMRIDISPTIYFFSRWEANYARILNHLGTQWVHQPRTFQLKTQRYTPDFYLPETGTYIEIKNYFSRYSKKRDDEFRELYPSIKLNVILKEDYMVLQKEYSHKIPRWEYANSPTS